MSSLFDLPLLSLLVWAPAAGAFVVMLVGGRSRGLGRGAAFAFAGAALLIATVLVRGAEPATELRTWIPALGVSYELGLDRLALAIVGWIVLLSVPAVHLARDRRDLALVLLAETLLLGLVAARDAFLLLSFQGAAIVCVALLVDRPGARRLWLVYQLSGFVLFVGLFLVLYHTALVQSGFPTTELTRWASLVVFPAEERRLFLVAAAGAAVAAPLFPFTAWVRPVASSLTPAGRVMFLGGMVLAPGYAVARLALPATRGGAESWAVELALLALASIGFSLLASRSSIGRGAALLLPGLQGIALAGLVIEDGPGPLGVLVPALALGAAALWSASAEGEARSRWPGLVFGALVVLGLFGLVGTLGFEARWLGTALSVGAALMGLRLIRATASSSPWLPNALVVAPVLLWWLWAAAAPSDWRTREPDSPAVEAMEDSPEEGP